MPRGGKRPGAGAPRGNLNALKHGRHSTQLQQLAVTLALLPAVRDTFIKVARRQRRQRRAAAVAGHLLLTQLLRACLAGLQDNQPESPPAQSSHASKTQNSPDNNQNLNLTPEVNQTSVDRYRKAAPRRVGERPSVLGSGFLVLPRSGLSTPSAASGASTPTGAPGSPSPASRWSAPAPRSRRRSPAPSGSPSPGR
jgi:hypothetical protein